jgi:hypothetical protein
MNAMQQNMEAALCNIVDNNRRGLNQGGHEVNQYSTFKDFMAPNRRYSRKLHNP